MRKIKFLPFYIISIIPISWLYVISDLLYIVLYKGIKYRKKVVRMNLKNSFPNLTNKQLKEIEIKFYKHICDVIFETLKGLTLTKTSAKKRYVVTNPELVEHYYQNNRNVMIYATHYGNWEWLAYITYYISYINPITFYQPLSNKYFNELFNYIRAVPKNICIPSAKGYRSLLKLNQDKQPTFSCLIGDLYPRIHSTVYWSKFLNQDTPFLTGIESLAIKTNAVVLFPNVKKTKRGFYELTFELIEEYPQKVKQDEITKKFIDALEQKLKVEPNYWLWSHKRWKDRHKKP